MRSDKVVFLKHLASLGSFPSCISKIRDVRTGTTLFQQAERKRQTDCPDLVVLQDVPGYLEMEWEHKNTRFKTRTLATQKTYVVDLDQYKDADAYLNRHFGPKSRSSLKRYKVRLEGCFKTEFKVYHGEVDKGEYDALFNRLEVLMRRRFNQKKERNYELQHLEEIKGDVYPKLLEKQASIFVILANGTPISIRVNLMKGKLAFYLLSAYDPNYDVFRVGKLDMWQNIRWLLENDFKKYDLLKGYGYIKEVWSDSVFDNNLILFNGGTSLMGRVRFQLLYWRTKCPVFLVGLVKELKLDRTIKGWMRIIKSRRKEEPFEVQKLGSGEQSPLPLNGSLRFPTTYNTLDREIIKLAYRHQHRVDEVLVHKIGDGTERYHIQIGAHAYLLKFKSNQGKG